MGIAKVIINYAVIDLNFIRATVDLLLEKFVPFTLGANINRYTVNELDPALRRSDVEIEDRVVALERKEELKAEITTVVGAVLSKQQCWEKTACLIGLRTRNIAAKDVFFM